MPLHPLRLSHLFLFLLLTFFATLQRDAEPDDSEMSATPKLFSPIKVGDVTLQHRVAMAPLTRFRADSAHVHGDLAVEYYKQRGSTPGTLLITEATFISQKAGGYGNVPGIWNDKQVAAWKRVRRRAVFSHRGRRN